MAYIDHYYHYFYDEIWVGTTESIQSSTLKFVTPTNLWAHLNALLRFVIEILYNERLDVSCVHVGWIGVVSGFIRILQTTPGLHPSEQDPNKWPNSNDQRTKFIFSVKNESYWSVQKEHWEHGAVPLTFEF